MASRCRKKSCPSDEALPANHCLKAMFALFVASVLLVAPRWLRCNVGATGSAAATSGCAAKAPAADKRPAERVAGFLAKSRRAGPHRVGDAGSARQGQGGDLQRRRARQAGRHRHALQDAGGVLRPGRRNRRERQAYAGGARPGPAASRRSSVWKRAAAWW